jgi:flagellar hook assembly protein FlgD
MRTTRRSLAALVLAAAAGTAARPIATHRLDARATLATLQFDSLVVTPLRFSPNGDGVQDTITVSYVLFESTTVDVVVRPAASSTVLDSLLTATLQAPGRHRVQWDGRDAAGSVQADGDYTMYFAGVTRRGAPLANDRRMRLDNTAPQVQILAIDPDVLIGSPPAGGVRMRVRVTQSEIGDSLRAVVVPPVPAGVDSVLKSESAFVGDGEYIVTLPKSSAERFAEGRRKLRARVTDRAGNRSTAVDSFDIEVRGPTITILHPSNLNPIAVQTADSLTGRVFDRNGLASLRMRLESATDTLLVDVPLRAPVAPDSASRFHIDLSTAAAAEGRYGLRLVARDALALPDSVVRILEVDRTDPNPLAFESPPPAVTSSAVVTLRVVVDSTMSRVTRTGGAAVPQEQSVGGATRLNFDVSLNAGENQLRFTAFDRAGNASMALVATVTWTPAAGIRAPDRFRAGDAVQVDVGSTIAAAVELRIYDMAGNLVRKLEPFPSPPALVHTLTWDLRNGDQVRVHNGAYLLQARIRPVGGGAEQRAQTAIAVVE